MKEVNLGEAMKEGMRRLASGVCVLSCRDGEGLPSAMTATSVTSVSDSPASLLVCVNHGTNMYQALNADAEGRFVVNLLASDHQEVSNVCAFGEQGPSRMETGAWNTDGELPYLEDGLASFFCKRDKLIEYGTHGIFIAEIERVLVNEDRDIDPLLYLNGGYGQFGEV